MDDIFNNGYNSENGTPYEPPVGENGYPQSGQQTEPYYQPYDNTAQQQVYQQQYVNSQSKEHQDNSGYNPYGNIRQYDSPQFNNNGYQNNYNGYPNNNDYQNGYPQNFQPAYNNGYQNQWAGQRQKTSEPGLAIASMVIALVNLIIFRTLFSVIAVPLSLIFAIVSLAKKKGGTGFAVTGIIASIISALIFGTVVFMIVKLYPDMMYFAENQQQIVEDYREEGKIPERFEKYTDPKYDRIWNSMGCDDFNEFFGELIKRYNTDYGESYGYDDDFEYYYDDPEEDYDLGITDLVFT